MKTGLSLSEQNVHYLRALAQRSTGGTFWEETPGALSQLLGPGSVSHLLFPQPCLSILVCTAPQSCLSLPVFSAPQPCLSLPVCPASQPSLSLPVCSSHSPASVSLSALPTALPQSPHLLCPRPALVAPSALAPTEGQVFHVPRAVGAGRVGRPAPGCGVCGHFPEPVVTG